MTKDEFIAEHVSVCQAGRANKYDSKKSGSAVHSLAYSRRKCAKKLWKDFVKRQRADYATIEKANEAPFDFRLRQAAEPTAKAAMGYPEADRSVRRMALSRG